MTDLMNTKKPKTKKQPYPFPVELIDQLLAQVLNKDAESILGEAGLAGQLKKMLAERMLTAELNRHLANEEAGSKLSVQFQSKYVFNLTHCHPWCGHAGYGQKARGVPVRFLYA